MSYSEIGTNCELLPKALETDESYDLRDTEQLSLKLATRKAYGIHVRTILVE
jgi:hypothetical protein